MRVAGRECLCQFSLVSDLGRTQWVLGAVGVLAVVSCRDWSFLQSAGTAGASSAGRYSQGGGELAGDTAGALSPAGSPGGPRGLTEDRGAGGVSAPGEGGAGLPAEGTAGTRAPTGARAAVTDGGAGATTPQAMATAGMSGWGGFGWSAAGLAGWGGGPGTADGGSGFSSSAGAAGFRPAEGTAAAPGMAGASGTAAAPGTSGASGTTAASATAGASGTAGVYGTAGAGGLQAGGVAAAAGVGAASGAAGQGGAVTTPSWDGWCNITGDLPLPNRGDGEGGFAGDGGRWPANADAAQVQIAAVARHPFWPPWLDVFATVMNSAGQGTLYWLPKRGFEAGQWGFRTASGPTLRWTRITDPDDVAAPLAAVAREQNVVDIFTARKSDGCLYTKAIHVNWESEDPFGSEIYPSEFGLWDLDGAIGGQISVVAPAADALDVAARGAADDVLYWSWRGGSWSPVASIGAGASSDVTTATRYPSIYDVFMRGGGTGAFCWRSRRDDEDFGDWTCGDEIEGAVVPVTPEPESLSMLAQSPHEGVLHWRWEPQTREVVAQDMSADGFAETTLRGAKAVRRVSGSFELFTLDELGQVHCQTWYENGTRWENPVNLGGKAASIAVTTEYADVLDVVAVDADTLEVWWRRWTSSEAWGYHPEA